MVESSSSRTSFDSAREHIGSVYAKGLLGAAESHGLTDRVLSELDSLIDDVLDQLTDWELVLASARISVEAKQGMLERAFAGKMTPLLLNFLKVLARHRRLDCLRQIRSAARHQYNAIRGTVEVEVHTAEPVSSALMDQIVQRLTISLGRQVELTSHVEPELLGGLVVRVGDTVFDGSLENRLENMRTEMLDRTTGLIRDSLQRFLVSDQ